MGKEKMNCIDCGTEFCPCKLAESGECIMCSQLQGKSFCDCCNWKGVCVYQEFFNNGMKAKEGRKTFSCRVISSEKVKEEFLMIKFQVPHKLAVDLLKPGSYIFIRTDENYFFDVPISVMDSDVEKDEVTIAIEIRGVKTKKLLEASKEKEIVIRGPYWNGVFGLDNLDKLREDNVLVLARGIGLAPMMPVLKRLKERENYIDLFIDTAPFKDNFAKEYLDKYSIEAKETNLLGKGVLSEEGKFIILNSIKDKNIKHIHLAGADILTYSVIEFLDSIGNDTITLSCCNNFKMCCGEGICGACTARYAGHKVKRFCKTQTEPRNIFEGRRLI